MAKNQVSVLVGADPELFVKAADGKFVSAHTMVPGTKVAPHEVKQGAVQVDGLAAEFNITPANTSQQFISNIKQVLTSLKGFVGENGVLTAVPTATFEKGYFDSLPPEVKELGCNPDFNAWTGLVNPAPDASDAMRTAAGHVHAGWCDGVDPFSKFHFEDCCSFIKELDFFVGIYSLKWDPDNTRRSKYGRAGAFRPKSYGAEYRVPSNVWLKSPRLQEWIFNSVQSAFNNLVNGKSMVEQFGDYAQRVIDNNEVDWNLTEEGKKVHEATHLPWPDVNNLIDIEDQLKKTAPNSDLMKEYERLAQRLGVTITPTITSVTVNG